jgi:hypothetical protein
MNAKIFRASHSRDNPYRMISRALFEDNRLSLEARGLMGYILVKPDDWQVKVTDLVKQGKAGKNRIYRILNELMQFGYCQRVDTRNAKGQVVSWDYSIYEHPLPCFPEVGNRDTTK